MSDKTHFGLAVAFTAISGAVGGVAAMGGLPDSWKAPLLVVMSVIGAVSSLVLKPAAGGQK